MEYGSAEISCMIDPVTSGLMVSLYGQRGGT
jgi:hypothetical protein